MRERKIDVRASYRYENKVAYVMSTHDGQCYCKIMSVYGDTLDFAYIHNKDLGEEIHHAISA
jgi:hypothetical protein